MKRIPKCWLRQSVQYCEYLGKDKYQNITYADAVTLSNIRIEYNVQTVNDANGETQVDDAVVYYDPVQSSPAGLSFKRRSKIIFGGDDFVLRLYDPKFDEKGVLHHAELRLVGSES
jgi:hypothetical protein